MKITASLLAIVACMAMVAPASAAEETTVPVTKVTAFSSGVAYFEHNGEVTGDAEVLLKFKVGQINDILKSMVLMDLDGGNITGVTYASRDPVSRALKSFGIDISGDPTLGKLLKQIRGATVVISAPVKITGKILGVETKTKHILPANTLIRQEILNLLTNKGIKALPLDTISDIKLADEKLNTELNKALALLVESRDSNRKPVKINFTGKGKRGVRIGYINEAPVWKTSYRLVLGGKEQKKDKAFMQGWAIVENTSDFDWEKVQLTLVSGRPISFIQDLYTPLYVPRPVVRPQMYASLRPQTYDEGIAAEKKMFALKPSPARARGTRAYEMRRKTKGIPSSGAVASRLAGGIADEAEMGKSIRSSVRSVAAAKAVGELFSYQIKTPVTLPRRKSAMLPIINQDVSGRKVSIYNQSVMAKHPLNGLWLTNDTKLSLLAGPVTVFDGGTYAGDAQIGNLSAKDKRLLSYAIDLKVKVDPTESSTSKITSVKIVRGVIYVTRKYEYKKSYVIKNKADAKRTLVIEHPRRSERKLISPDEPAEKTSKVYRFETDVPAGKTGKFVVAEEQVTSQSTGIWRSSVGTLTWYTTNREILPKVREAIAEAIRRKNALTAAERKVKEIERQIATLNRDQQRNRSNMGSFRSTSSTGYKRFAKKVLDIETKIEELQAELDEARANVKSLRKLLEDYISKMNVD